MSGISEPEKLAEDAIYTNIDRIDIMAIFNATPRENVIYFNFTSDNSVFTCKIRNNENQDKIISALMSAQIALTQKYRVDIATKDGTLYTVTVWNS
ncbi:hypothetical protein KXR64_05415 [Brucella intermedia]|uniref:Uncharacterized protein n=3 Tax=Brucella intermedia TaxID=94625 RepID=A0ABR6AKJ6_9HYPH|nr:hypothetical protein [Brucella intermedia]ERI16399.1 hypothetical protein O206_01305 [Ochrobactrum sp. EGD-AQ16]HCH73450.1 hypothetical protein [Ochrobactrum sp.]ELT50780.1 hypothetical protein D584_01500 [Brucella intermedia M86]KAB2697227.1 hypothetical protein F9K72_03555 [Brucella intermedia]KAB2712262.1 hypothetical protein F9K80_06775 [Brucella intermedia]